ncbi:MAG: GGDEF domain-containing protein [Candidatus Eremiobacterota bacterium]
MACACRAVQAPRGALYLQDEAQAALVLAAASPDPNCCERVPVSEPSDEFLGALRQAPVPLLDLTSAELGLWAPDLYRVCRANSLDTCFALIYRDRWLGVLALGGRALSPPDFEFLALLTRLAASFVSNLQHQTMALVDYTTGLHSGRYFSRRVDQELKRATRYGHCFSLVVMDLDDFKAVNDTYGHQMGDRVLRDVAGTLTSCCRRDVDVVARYGGEEFVFLLPHTPLEGARCMAERVLKRLATEPVSMGASVTMSAGVASFPEDGSDYAGLFAVADARLYAAKRAGKNQVAVQA